MDLEQARLGLEALVLTLIAPFPHRVFGALSLGVFYIAVLPLVTGRWSDRRRDGDGPAAADSAAGACAAPPPPLARSTLTGMERTEARAWLGLLLWLALKQRLFATLSLVFLVAVVLPVEVMQRELAGPRRTQRRRSGSLPGSRRGSALELPRSASAGLLELPPRRRSEQQLQPGGAPEAEEDVWQEEQQQQRDQPRPQRVAEGGRDGSDGAADAIARGASDSRGATRAASPKDAPAGASQQPVRCDLAPGGDDQSDAAAAPAEVAEARDAAQDAAGAGR